MKLTSHGRYDYLPIAGRPAYDWPNGKRLAVYLGLNLEHFAFGEGLGAELAPSAQPDVLNYAWRDYGNRVGAWRMLELFEAQGWPASVLVNTAIYDYAPELVAAFRKRGDEIVGHGRTNSERQGALDEAAERALIEEATARIAGRRGGRPPAGSGPGSRKARSRPISSPRPDTPTCSTGAWTTSRSFCARAAAEESSPCPIRRR